MSRSSGGNSLHAAISLCEHVDLYGSGLHSDGARADKTYIRACMPRALSAISPEDLPSRPVALAPRSCAPSALRPIAPTPFARALYAVCARSTPSVGSHPTVPCAARATRPPNRLPNCPPNRLQTFTTSGRRCASAKSSTRTAGTPRTATRTSSACARPSSSGARTASAPRCSCTYSTASASSTGCSEARTEDGSGKRVQ